MGINPTPTNHRSFTFDGKSTREFGVYITGEGVFNAPERAVEMISIPGRDGEYALDQGHFNNIEVTYRAGIVADSTTDFAEAISNFRNWLKSRKGYCRLSDEYNPDEYRMAVFKNVISVEHEGLETGEFDITFNCKPQRWLTEGETPITIGEWGETETYSGEIVSFDAAETDKVKSLEVDLDPIQDLHGYDAPWVEGAGANKWDEEWELGGITWSSGGLYNDSTMIRTKNYIPASANTTYYAFGNLTNGIHFYDSGYTHLGVVGKNNATFTTPANTAYIKFVLLPAYGTTYKNDIAINYPSTVTTYSPYSNICPISGYTEVDVEHTGKNLAQFRALDSTWSGITMRTNGSSIAISGTPTANVSPWSGATVGTYETMKNGPYPAGTYTLSCRGFDMQVVQDRIIAEAKYADGSSISGVNNSRITPSTVGGSPNDKTFTTTKPFKMDFWLNIQQGSVCDFTATIQLEKGSTATTYEPYNGTTYTTTLPSTTYGGTLDVVSGLLTVTHGIVDLGTLNWAYENSGSYTRFYSTGLNSLVKKPSSDSETVDMKCSALKTTNTIAIWQGTEDGIIAFGTTGTLNARIKAYTTAAAFKTAVSGYMLIYPLATPTTTQLTPQQVALLLGENHIFADSGNVTVEVGQNPMALVNPTPFDSEPLLAVDGYGTIGFNGYEIEINNEVMGDVIVAEADDVYRPTARTITIQEDLLNTSDTFVVNAEFRIQHTKTSSNQVTSITLGTATGCSAVYSRPNTVNVVMDSATFTKGTSATATCSIAYSAVTTNTGTVSCTQTCTVTYNGTDTLTFSMSGTNITNTANKRTARHGVIYGDSTISVLGNPTYIDCEIGECYMIKNSEIISLNQYIDLGSDLPTLPPGATEITFDNTVTELKVTPRWWKV